MRKPRQMDVKSAGSCASRGRSWIAAALCLWIAVAAPSSAQKIEGLYAGSVVNASEDFLRPGPRLDSAAPGDLVFVLGEGFGTEASGLRVLLDGRQVPVLPEPIFRPGLVAFVVPYWAEGEVAVSVEVGGRASPPRPLKVEAEAGAPPDYARRTLLQALAMTFLLQSEVELAVEAGIPLDPELSAATLGAHRRSILTALEQLETLPAEEVRRLDQALFDAHALERVGEANRALSRQGPDCDDVERFAGHAANALSGIGSIVGGCIPGPVGGCIGGILSGLGNAAGSVQAEAARECARQKEEEEKKRWEQLFADLEELKAGQRRLEAKLDGLAQAVARLEAKSDRLEAKLDEIERKLDRLEMKADRQADALAKLEAKADKIERKLDRQEKKLDTLEIKLDRLEIKADKAEKKLDKIEQKLDRQEKKLDKIEKKLDAQERKLDAQERKLDRQEQKLDRQEQKLDRQEQKLDRGSGGGGGPGSPDLWDFGDAPDGEATGYPAPFAQQGRFPSRLRSAHAGSGFAVRHRAGGGPGDRIGATVDGEVEARTPDQDRDDLAAPGAALVTDRRGRLEVTLHADPASTAPRYLNLLWDLGRDGDWTDPGDRVVSNRATHRAADGRFLPVDAVRLETRPDGSLEPGRYWLRLSLTREPLPDAWDGSGPAAGYDAGETEDFLAEVR